MELLQINLVIAYLLITFYFLINWLRFFNSPRSLSVEDKLLSIVVLIVATIFWPFVVPISFLKFLKVRELQVSSVIRIFKEQVASYKRGKLSID